MQSTRTAAGAQRALLSAHTRAFRPRRGSQKAGGETPPPGADSFPTHYRGGDASPLGTAMSWHRVTQGKERQILDASSAPSPSTSWRVAQKGEQKLGFGDIASDFC